MIFNPVSEAVYDTLVKYEASIRSFIKHTYTVWKKGKETIDTDSPKYKGSSTGGCHPVLCINNVNEEDEDVYTIHVSNKWGKKTLSTSLVLIGSKDDFVFKIRKKYISIFFSNSVCKILIYHYMDVYCIWYVYFFAFIFIDKLQKSPRFA